MSTDEKGSQRSVRIAAEALVATLARLRRGHEKMLALIAKKREAIRRADIEAISGVCRDEEALMGEIGGLEKRRLDLVGLLTEALAPGAAAPMGLRAIAGRLDDAAASRLLEHAEALRAVLQEVRRESSIVAAAARALSRHVSGIMQTVNGALSRVGIYERRGRIAVGSQLDYSIDMKS